MYIYTLYQDYSYIVTSIAFSGSGTDALVAKMEKEEMELIQRRCPDAATRKWRGGWRWRKCWV